MNRNQILFGIIAIAISVVLAIIDNTTPRFHDTLTPLGVIISFFILPLAIIGIAVILLNLIGGHGITISYRQPESSDRLVIIKKDPMHISRAIEDPIGKEEYVIYGRPSSTYREVLLADWPFHRVPKSGDWIVKDERGNDISNTPLERYDSIATIEYQIPQEVSIAKYTEKSDDRNDEYTSIDQGVEYYD